MPLFSCVLLSDVVGRMEGDGSIPFFRRPGVGALESLGREVENGAVDIVIDMTVAEPSENGLDDNVMLEPLLERKMLQYSLTWCRSEV